MQRTPSKVEKGILRAKQSQGELSNLALRCARTFKAKRIETLQNFSESSVRPDIPRIAYKRIVGRKFRYSLRSCHVDSAHIFLNRFWIRYPTRNLHILACRTGQEHPSI